jgi:internalin A
MKDLELGTTGFPGQGANIPFEHASMVKLVLAALLLGATLPAIAADPPRDVASNTNGNGGDPDWLKEALRPNSSNASGGLNSVTHLSISQDGRASSRWSAQALSLLSRFANLHDLEITGPGLEPKALESLAALGHLERLGLYSPVTDDDMKAVASIPGLKSLKIAGMPGLNEVGMRNLAASKSLEDLELHADTQQILALEEFKNLRVLRLGIGTLTDAKMKAIGTLKGVGSIELTLDRLPKAMLASTFLSSLRGMPNIEALEIPEWALDSPALEIIGGLSNLKRLNLQSAKLKDADLAPLARLKGLRELNLAGTGVTDSGFALLGPLVGLERLFLNDARLSDACRTTLAPMTSLRALSLTSNRPADLDEIAGIKLHPAGLAPVEPLRDNPIIGDTTVAILGTLQHLEHVNIAGSDITDAGLRSLAALRDLQVLCLAGCPNITDQGLVSLAKIEGLRVLYLEYTKVTEKGIAALAGLKELRTLTLMGCRQLDKKKTLETLKGLKGLKVQFPGRYAYVTIGSE